MRHVLSVFVCVLLAFHSNQACRIGQHMVFFLFYLFIGQHIDILFIYLFIYLFIFYFSIQLYYFCTLSIILFCLLVLTL